YLFCVRVGTPYGRGSSTTQPYGRYPPDFRHSSLSEPIGGDGGRYTLLLRHLENLRCRVEDLRGLCPGAFHVEAADLVGHLDHAAGVDHVVGSVEDAALRELLLHTGVGELVVRGTAHDLGAQQGDGVVVQRAAERAGGQHVDVRRHQRVPVGDHLDLGVALPHALHGAFAHVADHDLGAVLDQVVHQPVADLAHTLDADPAPAQRGRAVHVLGRGAHALEDAEGGQDRGVPGAAVRPGTAHDVGALPGDDVHVLAVGADVAGGDV